MKILPLNLCISLVLLFVTTHANAVSYRDGFSFFDSSGKVETAVYTTSSTTPQQIFKDFEVRVPDDYLVIGGGVVGARISGPGNMLTASYPNADLSAWLVSTKDHIQPHAINITAYAIGLKIKGLTRAQLKQYITVRANYYDTPLARKFNGRVEMPSTHQLIGGGFDIFAMGSVGALAYANYPDTNYSWAAKTKDHISTSVGYVNVYAIGIEHYLPGVGYIQSSITTNNSVRAAHPSITTRPTAGFALTGCGAETHWTGYGSLLWALRPDGFNQECFAGAKDHLKADPATITGYALGIKVI